MIKCLGTNCGAILGRLIDVTNTELPCLSAEAIVLINEHEDKRIQAKKWKKILSDHFTPVEIRQLDIQKMRDANQTRTPLNFELNLNGILQNIIREA
ncbi:hypothetical protein L5515_011031 [Caenorhabditis briggsae]|nr:hypothetical protein L3Y34_003902 [Caenorhabditis briggsae]UMM27987.1 hypothetical protein L5515_011031 [Caenorhabditis briggsae]